MINMFWLGVVDVRLLYCCDNSVCEQGWRYRKRGTQATCARQGRVTRVLQRESFERTLCLRARVVAWLLLCYVKLTVLFPS